MSSHVPEGDTLQDSLFTDGAGDDTSLIAALAKSNPRLAERLNDRRPKVSRQARQILERISRADTTFGARTRERQKNIRLGEHISERFEAFLKSVPYKIDQARVFEVALDDLLDALGF